MLRYTNWSVGRSMVSDGQAVRVALEQCASTTDPLENYFWRQRLQKISRRSLNKSAPLERPPVLPCVHKIAAGERHVIFAVSEYAARNSGQASEEVMLFETLREMGLELTPDKPDVLAVREEKLQKMTDARVTRAAADAIESAKSQFDFSPQMNHRLAVNGPNDPASAETKTFYEALKAFRKYLDATGKRTDSGKLAKSPSQYKDWPRRLEVAHDDCPF